MNYWERVWCLHPPPGNCIKWVFNGFIQTDVIIIEQDDYEKNCCQIDRMNIFCLTHPAHCLDDLMLTHDPTTPNNCGHLNEEMT